MTDDLTVVATYLSSLEADMAQRRLEALGVAALVAKDNCGGMEPQLDQQGVKLLVADADLAKARDILSEEPTPAAEPAWVCPQCGEKLEGGFDTCWNCGFQRV